jgi:hypothetical protein
VSGVPKDSTRCALARCLWAIVGSERSISNIVVTDRSIYVKRSRGRIPLVVGLPKPLKTFIRAFDSGCYPELIGRQCIGAEAGGIGETRTSDDVPTMTSLSGHTSGTGHASREERHPD